VVLKVHTADGATFVLDMHDDEQAKHILRQLANSKYQDSITGITVSRKCAGRIKCPACGRSARILCNHCGLDTQKNGQCVCGVGSQYSLPRPEGFSKVNYHIEQYSHTTGDGMKEGEKVICFADDVRATLVVHHSQPAIRVSILKIGKQRYNPFAEQRQENEP
jgi:hypothetical protein